MQDSERLGKQIDESRHRLTEVDTALEAVAADLLTRAGEAELDTKTIARLVGEKGKLAQEREVLLLRLGSLEQQQHTALRTEAGERLKVILVETNALHQQGQKAVARISTLMKQLEEALTTAFTTRQQQNLLRDEGRYLSLSFDLQAPVIEAAPVPDPQLLKEIQQQLEAGQQMLQQSNGWQRKTQAQKEELHRRTAAQAAPRPATYQKNATATDAELLQAAREQPITLPLVKRLFGRLGNDGKTIRIGREDAGEPMSEPRETKLRQLQGRGE